ncbi:MAG TPA: RlpA-like double-psi beta-barrel domain-containing protein [Gaiellaceae bacterium]|nr:RlpA-like double-psi beta-barrel domain-containing protein [Gaiellaceae bacterium]
MTSSAGLRASALAGIALIGIAVALAAVRQHGSSTTGTVPTAAGQWFSALAAPYTPSTRTQRSACGVLIGPDTIGVAHPVLPCGTKLYVELGSKQVLTQVIDRGHTAPGRTFDVTQALAKILGLQGSQTIRWRFAS